MNSTVVIGLGNKFLSDEGVGIMLVEILSQKATEFPDVDFIEMGTGGMTLLHALAGRKIAIILDCARMGVAPGAIRRFTPDTVRANGASRLSLHEGDVFNLIVLARSVDDYPERVVFFGIQPETLAPGESVSPTLRARVPEYLDAIIREIRGCSGGKRPASMDI